MSENRHGHESAAAAGAGSRARASAAPTLRPALPLAKRLNRNALTVAGVLMGITVLTAVVVLRPAHEDAAAGTASARGRGSPDDDAPPPRPTFLDRPLGGGAAGSGGREKTLTSVHADGLAAPSGPRSLTRLAPMTQAQPAAEATPPLERGGTSATAEAPPRVRAYLAARVSPTGAVPMRLLPDPTPAGDADHSAGGDSIVGDAAPGAAPSSPSLARAPALSAATGTGRGAASAGRRGDRAVPMDGGGTVEPPLAGRLEPAGSPYTVRAGSVIPGMLLTGINSELPGDVVGQVSRDVYDSRTERVLLVPKGSRLVGSYDNQLAAGHGRLLVAWTRLILPDGRGMRLPGLALKDAAGQTGASGQVDSHWRRVFGHALLLSAVGAGAQLSQPRQASVLVPLSPGQVAAGALGQELSTIALDVIRRGMDAAPTVSIRQGQPFNVFVNGDLVFDGAYDERSTGAHEAAAPRR